MWGTTFNCPTDIHQLLFNHDKKSMKPPIAQTVVLQKTSQVCFTSAALFSYERLKAKLEK